MKQITIRYFALLREVRGLSSETVQTQSGSAADLYSELAARHGFRLGIDHIRVAVNDEWADLDSEIENGDCVTFIPPVAGG